MIRMIKMIEKTKMVAIVVAILAKWKIIINNLRMEMEIFWK
jgi:hypothetical protein